MKRTDAAVRLPEVHLVCGTRPEAVKIAPVAMEMLDSGRIEPVVVASGQHPGMVRQALGAFGLIPDEELSLERVSGDQSELYAGLLPAFDRLWERRPPDAVVVQGDTATTVAASLAAFWRRIPVVHLEAGLRSHDMSAPFPEEANRRLVSVLTALHLPPTRQAARHLAEEGIPDDKVLVIGNTVVDAIRTVSRRGRPFTEKALVDVERRARAGERRLILVTVHRRENWGAPIASVLSSVRRIIDRYPDVDVVLPAHPNPAVAEQVSSALGGCPRVLVTEPLEYSDLARLLGSCTLVLSDSGGLQEEAPSFGVPVLVLRETTERQEAVDAGCALLVGTDEERILREAHRILSSPEVAAAMVSAGNPFGDGQAGRRTEQAVAELLGVARRRPAEFEAGARRAAVG